MLYGVCDISLMFCQHKPQLQSLPLQLISSSCMNVSYWLWSESRVVECKECRHKILVEPLWCPRLDPNLDLSLVCLPISWFVDHALDHAHGSVPMTMPAVCIFWVDDCQGASDKQRCPWVSRTQG